jgi:hypothetical protein
MGGDPGDLAVLHHRLSPERTEPYIRAANGDLEVALDLYAWNADISAALLAGHYDRTLWRNCLFRAFPGQGRRRVHDAVQRLHHARNRLAHHEPMFNRPIAHLHQDALDVAGWICPITRSWIERHSRTTAVLLRRPRT